MPSLNILIVDDEENVRSLLRNLLEELGHRVIEACNGAEAYSLISNEIQLILLDVHMSDMTGIECLALLRQACPEIPVIMISSSEELDTVIEAMKLGAFWYVSKRNVLDVLEPLIEKAHKFADLVRDNKQLRHSMGVTNLPVPFIGVSSQHAQVLSRAARAAQLDSTVLITGESGTGKSILARLIHEQSARKHAPFILINCAALPRDLLEAELFGHERGAFTGATTTRIGRIEAANGGSLFLDEIGDLPLELQPKLLVFLQERVLQRLGSNRSQNVDVRIIAATNQSLENMCLEKRFREDLYYRLNVLEIEIPPLRARREDLALLIQSNLERIAMNIGDRSISIADEAKQLLLEYEWPGNVRELQNVLERAASFSKDGHIDAENLLPRRSSAVCAAPQSLAGTTLEELERRSIVDTLKACSGNKAAAARMLGITEKTIHNKVKKLCIN